MKTWKQVKSEYNGFLDSLELKQPQRRISALNKIEQCLKANYPGLFKGHALFTQVEKSDLKDRYKHWKGKNLNGAESQVINDFYKLALANLPGAKAFQASLLFLLPCVDGIV